MRIIILTHKKYLLKRLIILQVVVIFILFTHLTFTEASRRKLDMNHKYNKSDIMRWTTVVNNNLFYVYVDRTSEIVIIQGEVNTLVEKEKVEEYFRLKSPSNYRLICELIINN